MENKNKKFKGIATFLFWAIAIVLSFSIFESMFPNETHDYSEIVGYFRNHEVTSYKMDLNSGDMNLKLSNGNEINYKVPSAALIYSDIKNYVEEYNVEHKDAPMKYDLINTPDVFGQIINVVSFLILPILSFAFLGWMFMRQFSAMGGGANFSKAKVQTVYKSAKEATFADVAGADEEKAELAEIVDFLKTPQKYIKLGARIPKGVLLAGPPGTGKTLLARAVAGEANVPFLSISGSDFVEMYVGVGASRVRNLFDQAKKEAPCLIFIDEIDAVGRQRGTGLGGAHDEREQTLNQLLVEMDGFGDNGGVIVMAATNRADVLDPALLRPGRFDRQVAVGYPDVKGREEILKVHSKGKPLANDVDLKSIAKSIAGFTGADIENLINESAILSAKRGLSNITMKEIEESTVKVVMGAEKKSRLVTPEDKRSTAYHEGGHAITAYFCETQDKVHEISIIPRGRAGGYTLYLPEKDDSYVFRKQMLERIVVGLGGMVAEKIIFKDFSTGASNDIKHTTKLASSMVTEYGMSDLIGPIVYGDQNEEVFIGRDMGHVKNYSESTASELDGEIKRIVMSCYERAEKILTENIDKLHEVAAALIEKEKLNSEEFEAIMKGEVKANDLTGSESADTSVE